MESRHEYGRRRHQENKDARKQEQERLSILFNDEKQKKRAHQKKRRRAKLWNKIKENVQNFLNQPFAKLFPKKSEEELQKRAYRRRKKREKFILNLKDRFQNFVKHPFGKPISEIERIERKKEKRVKKHITKKKRAHFFTSFANKIVSSIRVYRDKRIRARLFKLIIPSLIFFILAYVTIYVLSMGLTAMLTKYWGISVTLANSVVYYNISPYSPLWTKGSVVSIFTTASIISFAISMFSLWLFIKYQYRSYYLKLYLMWMILIGQAMSIGSFAASFIRKQGIFYAIQWFFYKTWFSSTTMEYIFLFFSVIWLIVFGNIMRRLLLYSSPSATLLRRENRFVFYQFQLTIPLIFGIIGIIIINAPIYNIYTFIQLFTIFLMFLPLFLEQSENSREVIIDKVARPKTSLLKLFFIALLIVFAFRLIFGSGIKL
ncbi:MAG: hypothetical protein WCP69_11070 [Bacteroidota bacterium]